MRELTSHKVNGLNESLQIIVCDEPGAGGANHHYQIIDVSRQNVGEDQTFCDIEFQNGPILEAGVNGISNEALLAIVEHRLACFQAGPFACIENGNALADVRSAMDQLKMRTESRMKRGVEGTSVK